MEVEVLARISPGTRCAAAPRKCFTARCLSRAAKLEIYTTIIRPVVLYGCEARRMTKQMEHRRDFFENGMLRKICGPVYDVEEGAWRRRHSLEWREMTGVPLISDMVRAQRLRCAGHVASGQSGSPPAASRNATSRQAEVKVEGHDWRRHENARRPRGLDGGGAGQREVARHLSRHLSSRPLAVAARGLDGPRPSE